MSNLKGLTTYNIRSESDFPIQDTTTITLNTAQYNIESFIVTGKSFIIPDGQVAEIDGVDAFISGLVYTGTGDMFTGVDFASMGLTRMFISAPLGTMYNLVSTDPNGVGQVFVQNTAVIDVANWGKIEGMVQFSGFFNNFSDIGTGIDLTDVGIVSLSQTQMTSWKNQVTSFFSLDGTTGIDVLNLQNMLFSTNSNETIFDYKNTLVLGGSGITGNTYDHSLGGAIFATGSRDETDPFIKFEGNINMPDSIVFGNMYLASPQTVTIPGGNQGVPFIVNDTNTGGTNIWTELGDTSRFTFDSSLGRYTYIGLEDADVEIISSTSIEKVGGGSDFIATFIVKNGSVLPESKSGSENNNPTNVVSIADTPLSTGDYIELAVQNDDSTSNIILNLNNFIIKD